MKEVYAPHLGRTIRLGGRKIPTVKPHALKFASVLRADIPIATPPSTDLSTRAMDALRKVYLNSSLGDCVIAGRAHRIGLLTGAANGTPFGYTDHDVIAEYSRIGGYNPNDPSTDQGCDMSTAANDGVQNGYPDGSRDLGWVSVDASKKAQVMLAFYLVENLDLGLALPDAWISPFPSQDGFVWDVAGEPDYNNGHCVEVVDYDEVKGVKIATWGLLGWITWSALAKYAVDRNGGECLAHLNADQISTAEHKAPSGLDWDKVVAFFDSDLGGDVPTPAPTPDPDPAPVTPPSAVVTLQQAQAWAASGIAVGIKHAQPMMTAKRASELASKGLAKHWPPQ